MPYQPPAPLGPPPPGSFISGYGRGGVPISKQTPAGATANPGGGYTPAPSTPSPVMTTMPLSPSIAPAKNPSDYMSTLPLPSMVNNASSTMPTFGDIQKSLQLQTPGNPYLERAVGAVQPSSGISSDAQTAIDLINKQRDYYAGLGGAEAIGLAARRGLSGSSVEQFGVQQGINQANLSAMGATGNILTQNIQNNNALRQTQGNILGGYGNSLNAIQGNLSATGGNLTSDELTSLRNMALSQQYLQMQQGLGQQGINLGYSNINSAQQLAEQQARNQFLGSGASLLAPYIFGGNGGFGGMNTFGGLPNMGGVSGGFQPYSSGGLQGPYASGMSGGAGNLGLGMTSGSFGGIGGVGQGALSGGLLPNFGAGALGMTLGQGAFGANNMYSNAGGVAGGVAGSFFGPAGTAVGSFAGEGLGKAFGNLNPSGKLGAALGGVTGGLLGNNVFGGKTKTTQMEGSSGSSDPTQFGKPGNTVRYNSNEQGSFEKVFNATLNSYTPEQMLQRYSSATPDMLQTPLDKQRKQTYDRLASIYGPNMDPQAFTWALS